MRFATKTQSSRTSNGVLISIALLVPPPILRNASELAYLGVVTSLTFLWRKSVKLIQDHYQSLQLKRKQDHHLLPTPIQRHMRFLALLPSGTERFLALLPHALTFVF